ncbi:tetraspanin-10 [Conger conger]|uniref:tetraspanin-10 n=1 Tax=Conger conger TaxID=82655 RepID=UPI002A5A1A4F|nr:tetraspanin-10 [Conger conger]
MRQFNVLKFLLFWRTQEDDPRSKETAPLIPKQRDKRDCVSAVHNIDTQTAVFGSTNGEEVHDGKARQDWETPWSCDGVLKLLLFLGTLLFSAVGLGGLGLGLWGLTEKESFAQERIGQLGADPMLLFVCGGLLLALLSLVGCVGTLRENACLLHAFSAALLVLLSAQVLLAIVAFSLHGQIEGYLRSAMLTAMARYQDDLDLHFLTDELQMSLQCCGADSYRDWEINMYFNCSGPGVQACGVPPSCCVSPLEEGSVWNSQCGVGAQRLDEFSAGAVVFLGGCLGGLQRWVERNSGSIGWAGGGLLGAQVLGLFLSTRLLEHIQRSQSQRHISSDPAHISSDPAHISSDPAHISSDPPTETLTPPTDMIAKVIKTFHSL